MNTPKSDFDWLAQFQNFKRVASDVASDGSSGGPPSEGGGSSGSGSSPASEAAKAADPNKVLADSLFKVGVPYDPSVSVYKMGAAAAVALWGPRASSILGWITRIEQGKAAGFTVKDAASFLFDKGVGLSADQEASLGGLADAIATLPSARDTSLNRALASALVGKGEAKAYKAIGIMASEVKNKSEKDPLFYPATMDLSFLIVAGWFESGFNWDAKNVNSTATGMWQFLQATRDSLASVVGQKWSTNSITQTKFMWEGTKQVLASIDKKYKASPEKLVTMTKGKFSDTISRFDVMPLVSYESSRMYMAHLLHHFWVMGAKDAATWSKSPKAQENVKLRFFITLYVNAVIAEQAPLLPSLQLLGGKLAK